MSRVVFKPVRSFLTSALMIVVLLVFPPLVTMVYATANTTEAVAVKKSVSAKIPPSKRVAAIATYKTALLRDGKLPTKKMKLIVLGDSLGDGIWAGLYRAFRSYKNIKVVRKSKTSTGFVRLDYFDLTANLEKILRTTKVDIAVIMVGANDRQTIRSKDGRHRPGSKRWREIYASRVDTFIKKLTRRGVKVYWVGLPITRKKKFAKHMKMLNEIFREQARVNNVQYIETWNVFTDAKGNYSAYGKDIKGQVRKLRANDGVHFTMRGYRKLAVAAELDIWADILQSSRPPAVANLKTKNIVPVQKPIKLARLLPAKKDLPKKPEVGVAAKSILQKKPLNLRPTERPLIPQVKKPAPGPKITAAPVAPATTLAQDEQSAFVPPASPLKLKQAVPTSIKPKLRQANLKIGEPVATPEPKFRPTYEISENSNSKAEIIAVNPPVPVFTQERKTTKIAIARPQFLPQPYFSIADSDAEKRRSLKLALNTVAHRLGAPANNEFDKVTGSSIEPAVRPRFQADADYLVKNAKKAEKSDGGQVIRQALANDFQSILSIIQPEQATVVKRRIVLGPSQEARERKKISPLQPLQAGMSAELNVEPGLVRDPGNLSVASGIAGAKGQLSIESGTPDDNIEIASENSYQQDEFTGVSRLASIASVSGVDFDSVTDAEGVLSTIVFRTLLRGDAVPPKAGRGDDFSWPRD